MIHDSIRDHPVILQRKLGSVFLGGSSCSCETLVGVLGEDPFLSYCVISKQEGADIARKSAKERVSFMVAVVDCVVVVCARLLQRKAICSLDIF
jgi:hypothetical protein